MTYLVDANVFCEPTRPAPDPAVVEWLMANEGNFVVDAVVLGEIGLGVLSLPQGRKRARLETWFHSVCRSVECLPWDAVTSLRWARLVVELKRKGRRLPLLDSMIAASALVHDLTVATRNVADFKPTGARVLDPVAP
ncbi:MAG: type II toxin-antitoxin system VapC family toxin [Planctomycetes bacterium]|nr:type II toxin-antitoxin system VapC family toxin [Planctomycetota bacterium]